MAQLLVRDISDETVAALKARAKAHGRSAEAEHRAILQDVLGPGKSGFWERAQALQDKFKSEGRVFSDSAELIRQYRDTR